MKRIPGPKLTKTLSSEKQSSSYKAVAQIYGLERPNKTVIYVFIQTANTCFKLFFF